MWGGVDCMWEASRPPRGYGDVLEMLAGLMSLFKEPTTHCTLWRGKHVATTIDWRLLWAVRLITNTQLEAEARVRKLEADLGKINPSQEHI